MILRIESRKVYADVPDPEWMEVQAALKNINKKESRTCVVLKDEATNSYVKTYGSKRALAMEYQDAEGKKYLLGLGPEKPLDTTIQGTYGSVTVQLHEVLSVAHAYDVYEFFHRASIIPSRYSLREFDAQIPV